LITYSEITSRDRCSIERRDVDDDWFIVKNESATRLDFEPKKVYLNPAIDDVFAFTPSYTTTTTTPDASETRMYSPIEEWTIPGKAVPMAIDPTGHVLFRTEEPVDVPTKDAYGSTIAICNPRICSFNYSYWLNGKRIAVANSIMVPQFSSSAAPTKLPSWYEGAEKAFKYYGVFGQPDFDSNGNLVFFSVQDVKISKLTFDVSSIR